MAGLASGTMSGVAKEANLIAIQSGDLFSGTIWLFLWLKGQRSANPNTPMVYASDYFRGNNLFSLLDDNLTSFLSSSNGKLA